MITVICDMSNFDYSTALLPNSENRFLVIPS